MAKVADIGQSQSVSGREGQNPVQHLQTDVPPPPAEASAQPAQIILKNGTLTIAANNSDLAQILKDLSDKSGMTIQGLSKSPRIFGVYGPGNSREVLRSLFVGSGYNFIIVGGANDGVPREVLLSASAAAIPSEGRQEAVRDNSLQPDHDRIDLEERGPGAMYPVPPPATEDEGARIEQNMKRLEHLEERRNEPQ